MPVQRPDHGCTSMNTAGKVLYRDSVCHIENHVDYGLGTQPVGIRAALVRLAFQGNEVSGFADHALAFFPGD